VQTFTTEFIDAARPARHAAGDRWFVDETYVKVAGRWSYLYRAVDQHGQVVDVFVSMRRNAAAARVLFTRALRYTRVPVEVPSDRAPAYPQVIGKAAPAARQVTEQYANNAIEADHGRLRARLRPMRGLKRLALTGSLVGGAWATAPLMLGLARSRLARAGVGTVLLTGLAMVAVAAVARGYRRTARSAAAASLAVLALDVTMPSYVNAAGLFTAWPVLLAAPLSAARSLFTFRRLPRILGCSSTQ
jgi:IS6 family transposase